jgi:hypothetical protein
MVPIHGGVESKPVIAYEYKSVGLNWSGYLRKRSGSNASHRSRKDD